MEGIAGLEPLGNVLALLLTVMVLSFLVGDNPLFRFAVHLFIGVAAGYAGAIAWHNVMQPGIIDPLFQAGFAGLFAPEVIVTVLAPLVLILLMLLKFSPATARFGGLPLALLVGVGAAVVVGGAISGTLIPQSTAAMESLSPTAISPQTGETGPERTMNIGLMLIGTISTLIYFRFTSRGSATTMTLAGFTFPKPMYLMRQIGRAFIAITFGVMFAGALAATIIVLSERIQFMWTVTFGLLGRF